MTIEISSDAARIYRINPDDPRQVDVKDNKPRAPWAYYLHRDSATAAKLAMLRVQRGIADSDATDSSGDEAK